MIQERWKTNQFYDLAMNYVDKVVNTDDIVSNDITPLFLEELELMIKQGEIIKIEIKAKPREGKSTLALVLASEYIFEMLRKYGFRDKKEEFGFDNIARDQQEFNKKMTNPALKNNILVVDEFNELEASGENVTAEERLNRVFSDVQAGRYIHTINCSPSQIIDKNSDLIMEIIPTEKNGSYVTSCRLYYRFIYGGDMRVVLLGHVRIFVGNVIKNWEKHVKKKFNKTNPSEEDLKIIGKWAEKDWYVKYIVKKYEKMDLLTKEGIFRPRELAYSDVCLEIVKEFEPLSMMGEKVTKDMIETTVEHKYRQKKIAVSMLGVAQTGRRAMGILNGLADYQKYKAKMIRYKSNVMKSGIKPHDYKETVESYEMVMKAIIRSYKDAVSELEHYAKINTKYNEME